MCDGRDRLDVLVARIGECQGDRAHERAVAVVPFVCAAKALVERSSRRSADVEQAVHGIGALAVPAAKPRADIFCVHTTQLAVAVADGKRHRCVVRPRSRGLVVRAVAHHARAAKRPPRAKLIRHAERIGHCLSVDAIAQRSRHGASQLVVSAR